MATSPNVYQSIATWFRLCLLLTAIFNLFGAVSFAPPVYYAANALLDLSKRPSSFSLWVISLWIFIFGFAYAWMCANAKPEKFFIAISAACKIAIAILFFIFWYIGELPLTLLFAGIVDLAFAIAFIVWLTRNRSTTRPT